MVEVPGQRFMIRATSSTAQAVMLGPSVQPKMILDSRTVQVTISRWFLSFHYFTKKGRFYKVDLLISSVARRRHAAVASQPLGHGSRSNDRDHGPSAGRNGTNLGGVPPPPLR